MKLVSWNINGINSSLKEVINFIRKEDADVYCFQETKLSPEKMNLHLSSFPGYRSYFLFAERKGYSGVATFSRIEPVSVIKGIGNDLIDREARVLTLEFDKFYLVNVYFPNSNRELSRLGFKLMFNGIFEIFCENLRKEKPVVICGDFNVVHKEIDIANFKGNEGNAGVTREERLWFDSFLNKGYIDTFRQFHPDPGNYTYWYVMYDARKRNIGWRIDYFVTSEELRNDIKDSYILKDVYGSDHCPIVLELNV